MKHLSEKVRAVPEELRARLARNLPAAAAAINAEKDRVLGVHSAGPSRPGEPPHRHSGQLQWLTKAVPDAAALTIRFVTTTIGKALDGGTGRISPRPFVEKIIARSAAAVRAALMKQ